MAKRKSDIFDKLILVFYMDVRNMSSDDVATHIERIRESTTPQNRKDSEGLLRYFIPTHGQTRIECLNPPGWCCCDKKKRNSMEKKIAEVNDRLDRLVESMYPVKRKVLLEKSTA